jgi:hypothetical protein
MLIFIFYAVRILRFLDCGAGDGCHAVLRKDGFAGTGQAAFPTNDGFTGTGQAAFPTTTSLRQNDVSTS